MMKKPLYFAAATAICLGVGFAAWQWRDQKDPVSAAFCRKLGQEASYAKDGLDQYKMIVQGRDGWIFRTENDFRKDFTLTAQTRTYLLDMQRAFRDKGIDLIIAFPPTRGMTAAAQLPKDYKSLQDPAIWDNYGRMLEELQRDGLRIVGLTREEAGEDFFYRQNHHWTAAGAKRMADKIAGAVKELRSYAAIGKVSYATSETGLTPYESSFEKAFAKICGSKLPPENVMRHATAPAAAAGDSAALFDTAAEPEIVLLGTSNSVDESSAANFEGYLKEALQADVLNMAFIGAGIDTSIVSFLNSETFQRGGVKVVVWEVPGYYDFNIMDDKLFQQIIPAIEGSCAAAPVLEKTAAQLAEGRSTLFELPAEAALEGGEYYLRLAFSKPVSEPVSVRFHYPDDTRKQEFDRSERYPDDNLFYTLFKAEGLQKVSIEMPAAAAGLDADVQICALPVRDNLQN